MVGCSGVTWVERARCRLSCDEGQEMRERLADEQNCTASVPVAVGHQKPMRLNSSLSLNKDADKRGLE